MQQSHELVVVTHNGPVTYYVDGQNEFAGFEYDLAKLFAQDLSKALGQEVHLKVVVVDNITQIIPTLLKNKAHLAAANLTITHLREHLVRFGPPYQTVQQEVVFNKEKGTAPKSAKELVGMSVVIPKGTSYAERLAEISRKVPGLHWKEEDKVNSEELLERVAEGTLDATIADSPLVSMVQNYYPNLVVGFDFGPPDKLAWAFPKNSDDWLYRQADKFFARIQKDGTLRNLLDRYYGHSERLNQVDVTGFLGNIRKVLPQYVGMFKQAQELSGLDWRLLAAIGYQESHWDKFATSPTNVRGIMMLTEDTADRLGVTDRLDPRQSIIAGARYVLTLKDMIPARVPEPDRTWMALAAYNIGYAHLEDARVLAQHIKLNPDSWADVKKVLPLLGREEYFSTLKYGFARGGAPVVFVESIRTYYKILEKHEPQHTPIFPSFKLAKNSSRTTLVE
ncbi:MAG TPA: membrane-bound lytic murein transglycosylase MltF [Methylophilaceae bacterium]|nr:membrane-bound lytic murein transglycosylase MltF [Methylophilaceae bacterium]